MHVLYNYGFYFFNYLHLVLHILKLRILGLRMSNKKRILIVSHELSYSGAPLVLLPLLDKLKKTEQLFTLVSIVDGPLRKKLARKGIPIFCIGKRGKKFARLIARNYDLILANTIAVAEFVKRAESDSTILWWIHEGSVTFEYFKSLLPERIGENTHLLAVSEYSKGVVKSFFPFWPDCEIFRWGIADEQDNVVGQIESFSEFRIACIGSVESRKGQCLLTSALIQAGMENVSVSLAGRVIDSCYFEKAIANESLSVSYFGEMDHEDVLRLMRSVSLLCVPSIDEPVSAVAVEAMMLSVPVLVSSNCGIASCIDDGVNGFVFRSGSIADLANKLVTISKLPKDRLAKIGANGRSLYEHFFTCDQYFSSFIQLVQKYSKYS